MDSYTAVNMTETSGRLELLREFRNSVTSPVLSKYYTVFNGIFLYVSIHAKCTTTCIFRLLTDQHLSFHNSGCMSILLGVYSSIYRSYLYTYTYINVTSSILFMHAYIIMLKIIIEVNTELQNVLTLTLIL